MTNPRYTNSSRAFEAAKRVLPGGVNSPVRAYKSVGRDPIVVRSGKGARVTDVDGNSYIDYVMSYGPLLLGHCPPAVEAALQKAVVNGTSFGMPTEAETRLAQLVIEAVPSVEKVRFVNSGTEACMSAIRLARAATKRSKVIKCTGCYHGHSDALLVEAGSGATTIGVPSSPGVPASITGSTLLVPFNDLAAVERVLNEHGRDVAGLMVEPIAGNMGCVPPKPGYLQGLRDLCTKHGVLLLFDEVMTGFRVAYGGAQSIYKVTPDLTCLGKIVGGGLPCAAYGGRTDLMKQIAPEGPVYQAGTLSGNPLAMAAGIAMLESLKDGKAYAQLDRSSKRLTDGLARAASEAGVPVQITRVGSMVCVFFCATPIENYEQAVRSDTKAFTRFFNSLLDNGVVLPPSQYETWFVSTAHDDACIDQTIEASRAAFAAARA
ncbi:MAG: glutamate-1-semialdehyde 2,1-aminomutase [Planctomycetes bacterium]|nr:glutamate-1-semialdehyde 2,1-aminomutase [Planctomycetota bacterium]